MEKVPEWLRWLWLCKGELNKSESKDGNKLDMASTHFL